MFVRTSARAYAGSLRIYRRPEIQMRSHHPGPFSACADLPGIPLTQHAAGTHTPAHTRTHVAGGPSKICTTSPEYRNSRTYIHTRARAHVSHPKVLSTYTGVPAAAAAAAAADDEVQPLRELRQFRSLNWRWLDRLVAERSFPTGKTR